jgi:peptidoglycan/LPS O-acetylase OafA/YrhL
VEPDLPSGPSGSPSDLRPGQGRITSLDGMRAFAVLAVILFHAESNWTIGGYFGVDVFFVLSGYLITSLLLTEWRGTGGIALRSFWVRRARRLLPALFLMLAVVGITAVLLPQVLGSPGLLGDTLSTVGYVANWHLVAAHTNYFDTVANPSPLTHTWSLAIEEQFYLIWPLAVLALSGGLLLRTRKRRHSSPKQPKGKRGLVIVAMVATFGAFGSAVLMACITPTGNAALTTAGVAAVNRSYYGSDTRAQSLLVGAALAAVLILWVPVRTRSGRIAIATAGLVGAAGVVAMWLMVGESSALAFHGGFLLLSLATAGVIACVTAIPRHPVTRFLSLAPFAYLGRISYGIYLWYLPVLVVMTAGRTHLAGLQLLGARLAVIVAIAALSFHLVESPIHRGALRGWRSWVAIPVAVATVSLVPLLVPSLAAVVPAAAASTPQLSSVAGGSKLVDEKAALPYTASSAGRPDRPVRILLVGDSMAGSLGVGMSLVAGRFDAEVANEGSPGCSLGEASMIKVLWYTVPPSGLCDAADPAHLLTVYRSLVGEFDPDVVVYLARADTLDTLFNGSWVHVGDRSFDRWEEARFEQAVSVLGSTGARVVMLTSPYYDSGEQPDGDPWPENDPARVTSDNQLLRQAARSDPTGSSVIDLGKLVSPSNQFSTQVDGVTLRCSDGVHFTVPGGEWVGEQLLPGLVQLGRSHADAPAQRARPALAPQKTPGWYSSLPCGV